MHRFIDTFVKENLPPSDQLPAFLPVPGQDYPEWLNASVELLDHWVEAGHGDRVAFRSLDATMTYAEVLDLVCRYAEVLERYLDVRPGNRVLLRGRNSPRLAALHLAVMRVGGVVVSTMPMLRAGELQTILDKAKVSHAISEADLLEDLLKAGRGSRTLKKIVAYGAVGSSGGSLLGLDELVETATGRHRAFHTRGIDPCLIAFTSGTTGVPKGAVHCHRDLLAVADTYGANIVKAEASDVFAGSAPLAFTFGLGALVLFPMRIGASALLIADARPLELMAAIGAAKATVCFTAPTAYRAMLEHLDAHDISSLRLCVSAGETLPRATFDAFRTATGLAIADGIGSTEMLHIFISASGDDIRPGSTGKVVPGYEARIVDDEGREVGPGVVGWLAVRGPTGCRYLDDERQAAYVRDGWNVTGDAYICDEDGYFYYQSRMDDMIVSAGYNIAAPEVEGALLTHPAVLECAVVGVPDERRGQIVKAFVVLRQGARLVPRVLKDHVKSVIAPYKHPREIVFVTTLPKTLTGKLRRFELRLADAA